MKKLALISVLAVAGMAQAQYSGQYDGKVIFNGEVIDQTCTVKTDKGTQTIVLEKVPVSKLGSAGKVAGGKPFQIDLENCKTDSANQLVRAEFRSSPHVDAANAYTLKNTKEGQGGYATKVNLRLKESNGTPIRIGDASYTDNQFKDLGRQAAGKIDYSVEYYSTGIATVGKVESEVEYSIVYQ